MSIGSQTVCRFAVYIDYAGCLIIGLDSVQNVRMGVLWKRKVLTILPVTSKVLFFVIQQTKIIVISNSVVNIDATINLNAYIDVKL